MKKMAIIMGTEEYDHYPPTQFCHNDAKILKDTLVLSCDFAEQDVFLKLLSPNNSDSPNKILKKIESLVNKTRPGDTVLFYYAGHGAYRKSDSYLLLPKTIDADFEKTAIPLRDISNVLRKEGLFNIRIFDSCHSGQDVRQEGLNFDEFSRSILSGSNEGWLTFAACKAGEFSYSDPTLKHGVFTYNLVEAIKEYKDKEDIYPENLKISVCDKVSNWCNINNKVQTPTFNSAISGNIAIAKRRIAPQKAKPAKDIKENVVTTQQDIKERLDKLRKYERVGNEDHKKLLENYLIKSIEIFKSKKQNIQTYGLDLIIGSPGNADEIPDYIKKMIVKKIGFKDLRLLHEIRCEREYEKTNPLLTNFFSTQKKLISEEFIVSQDYSWPKSFFVIKTNSDGYLPNSTIFFYIVPLLVTARAVCGFVIDYGQGSTDKENIKTIFDPIILNLEEKSDLEIIEKNVNELIDTFNRLLKEQIEIRLKYLEWEMEQPEES